MCKLFSKYNEIINTDVDYLCTPVNHSAIKLFVRTESMHSTKPNQTEPDSIRHSIKSEIHFSTFVFLSIWSSCFSSVVLLNVICLKQAATIQPLVNFLSTSIYQNYCAVKVVKFMFTNMLGLASIRIN